MDIFMLMFFGAVFVCILLIGIFVVLLVWLQPFMGILRAKIKKQDLIILMDYNNRIKFLPAVYSKGIWYPKEQKFNKFTFIQRRPVSFQVGEMRVALVHDRWGITIDPTMVEALSQLYELGMTSWDMLELGIRKGQQALAEGRKPDIDRGEVDPRTKLAVNAFTDVRLEDLFHYVSDFKPTELTAHIDEQVAMIAEEYARRFSQFTPKKDGIPIIWIIIIILLIAVGGFLLMSGGGGIPNIKLF